MEGGGRRPGRGLSLQGRRLIHASEGRFCALGTVSSCLSSSSYLWRSHTYWAVGRKGGQEKGGRRGREGEGGAGEGGRKCAGKASKAPPEPRHCQRFLCVLEQRCGLHGQLCVGTLISTHS